MKKYILNIVAVFTVAALSFVSVSANGSKADNVPTEKETTPVVTVAKSSTAAFDYDKVLESRFLNMLNHNFAYNDDFKSVQGIVNSSVLALLDLRDAENEDYIAEAHVRDYIFNMYGIEIESFAEVNADFPQKDGYVYIVPKGFSVFEHKIKSVVKNDDGSFTVKTVIGESSHDSGSIVEECETLFVPNEKSAFGFSIIRSVIGTTTLSV